ncbi:MAG: tetratricopeptide repeat protein [Nitrospira sp.]
MLQPLLQAAGESRLVIFAGAGISMAPPTNLPSWRDFNHVVMRALADASGPLLDRTLADRAVAVVSARHTQEKLPPEYQAQLLAEILRRRYFDVIRHLDSNRPNVTHLAIAWLARLGLVRAVVTTNFDRVLETAFSLLDVPLLLHYQPEHFRALAENLDQLTAPGTLCHVLKLHGSVADPTTLIDTLAQRKRGFPPSVTQCTRHLLHGAHWLFLGFSGLDLEAEPNYLSLAAESEHAVGFTWMVRKGTQPKPAVLALKHRYGARAAIVEGELPEFVLELLQPHAPSARDEIISRLVSLSTPTQEDTNAALREGATNWASALPPALCGLSLAFVTRACAEPSVALDLILAILSTMEQLPAADAQAVSTTLSLVNNAAGILLQGFGRHEEAAEHFVKAIETAEDDDTRDRWRGNLATSFEALGYVVEAKALYAEALAGYRQRGDPAAIVFGLLGYGAFLIRQLELDEAHRLCEEAMNLAKAIGDEYVRGTTLNLFGLIAKLRADYTAALDLFGQVEQLFARLGDDQAAAAALSNRGEVLTAQGEFNQAEQVYQQSLAINRRTGRRENEASTYLALGLLERDRRNVDAARNWFHRAVDLQRELHNPTNEALARYRLATLDAETGEMRRAIEIAKEALLLVEKRHPVLEQDLCGLIGRTLLQMGDAAEAERASRRAVELGRRRRDPPTLAGLLQNLGLTLLLQQRDEEAATVFAEAAGLWETLDQTRERDYCRLCETAVRLDARIAKLSAEGHAFTDIGRQRQAASEMVRLYPELIAMYQQIGAQQLVIAFQQSAASSARFAGDVARALEWYGAAGNDFLQLGLTRQAREAFSNCESLLQSWVDTLIQQKRLESALPLLLQLAEIAEHTDNQQGRATALLNAAIITYESQQNWSHTKALAGQASALFAPDSEDYATAQRLIALCDERLSHNPP